MSNVVKVTLNDGLTPFVRGWLDNNPRMKRSVLKSTGWFVQAQLKKGSEGKVASSASWKERWALERRRLLNPRAPEEWYGELRRALGYAYVGNTDDGFVEVGWTSRTSAMYGRVQEEGYKRVVTPFVRKFFGERGIYFRGSTKFLEIPARPFIDAKYDEIRDKVPERINKQVAKYIRDGGFMKKIGKTRKYEVYK